LSIQSSTRAAEVTLAWDPSIGPNVAGYRVIYGFESRRYLFVKDVGNVTVANIELPEGGTEYYFAVLAYNALKVPSPPSEEVSYIPTLPPRLDLTAETDRIRLVWNSAPGYGYRVVHKPTLEAPGWHPVSRLLIARSAMMEWSSPINRSVPSAFYTLEVFPDVLTPPTVHLSSNGEGGVRLVWNSVPGLAYCVLYKPTLEAPAWIPISGLLTAESSLSEWMMQVDPDASTGFFRIGLIPDPDAPPIVQVSQPAEGQLRLAWAATPDRAYRVLYKPTLDAESWEPVSDILIADAMELEWTTSIDPAAPSGFFMVQAGRILNPAPVTIPTATVR
jgi:hypothetical protein